MPTTLAALAAPHNNRTPLPVEITLGQRERLADP
jgi:hypothetical protein